MYISIMYLKTNILFILDMHFIEQLHCVWRVCIRVYFRYNEQHGVFAQNDSNTHAMTI